jgi:tRNA pseudouridine55 synthase
VTAEPKAFGRGTLFLLDKPEGLTSHDVVERVRKATGVSRIGHSGTLDPMATGLLLLCAGGAARLQSFFTMMDKSYDGTIRLGRATTTYDREGEPVGSDRDASGVTRARVEEAAAAFQGEFLQAPPPYSAKKVKVTQLSFGEVEGGRVPFSISCSSGTYIRSIASDLGEKLSCGAHLEALRRSRIGVFSVGDAVTLERFEAMSPPERLASPHAVPLSRVPFPFPRVQLASLEAWKIRRGQAVPARGVEAKEGDWVTLLSPNNDMLALGQINPIGDRGIALIKPRIVLE